jgi:hypothetical protein
MTTLTAAPSIGAPPARAIGRRASDTYSPAAMAMAPAANATYVGFGTVRPRVQIPGPRPKSEYDPGVTARAGRAPDHSRIRAGVRGLVDTAGRSQDARRADLPAEVIGRLDLAVFTSQRRLSLP